MKRGEGGVRTGQRNPQASQEIATRIQFLFLFFVFFLSTKMTQDKEEGFKHASSFYILFRSSLEKSHKTGRKRKGKEGDFSLFCLLTVWWQKIAASNSVII